MKILKLMVTDRNYDILKAKAKQNGKTMAWMLNRMLEDYEPSTPEQLIRQMEVRTEMYNYITSNSTLNSLGMWEKAWNMGWYAFQMRKAHDLSVELLLKYAHLAHIHKLELPEKEN